MAKNNVRNCFIIIFLLSLMVFLLYHLLSSDSENYGQMPGRIGWLMVKSRNCPFCIQQVGELQKGSDKLKQNLKILDTELDAEKLKNVNLHNYKGVPHFQNLITGETFSGFTSIDDLEKKIGKDSVKQWKKALQTEQGRNARTFIHRGQKYDWDTTKFPI